MKDTKKLLKKSFNQPDERRDFQGHGHLDVLNFGEGESDGTTIGRGVFEPGWKWSKDVKPIAGTESCEAEHVGYCLKGMMTVKMDNGEEMRIKQGEAFYLPPGHDAWVEGNEPVELLDFTGYKKYAKTEAA